LRRAARRRNEILFHLRFAPRGPFGENADGARRFAAGLSLLAKTRRLVAGFGARGASK
jgi:hypothetical protein